MTADIVDLAAVRRRRQLPPAKPVRARVADFLGALSSGDKVRVGGSEGVFVGLRGRRLADGSEEWHCLVLAAGVMAVVGPGEIEPL